MEFNELLWFIFIDELIGALLVPVNDVYVLHASLSLNGLDIRFFIVACLGALLGMILNYFFGKFSIKILGINIVEQRKEINFFLYVSLLLIPFGFLGTLSTYLCGVVKLKFKNILLISSLITIIQFLIQFAYY